MKSRKFAIPYNHDKKLIETLINTFPDFISNIHELYFPIPYKYGKTGRVAEQSDDYEQEVIKLIEETKKNGICSNILLNAGCVADNLLTNGWMERLIEYLKFLYNCYGLDIVTISDFVLANKVKDAIPELKIECSSIAYVDSPLKASMWATVSDIIVIPHDLNKKMDRIREIKKAIGNTELKIMVNHMCMNGCPMFISHNNIEGHGNAGEIYDSVCRVIRKRKPWYIYSAGYIPPREIELYDDLIDTYKILDRTISTDHIVRSFGAYNFDNRYSEKREKMNNVVPEEVFKKVLRCNNVCEACNFCEQYYKKTHNRK